MDSKWEWAKFLNQKQEEGNYLLILTSVHCVFLFYSNLACKIALKICIFQTSFKEISLEFAKVFALEFFINLLLSYSKWQNYPNITFFAYV